MSEKDTPAAPVTPPVTGGPEAVDWGVVRTLLAAGVSSGEIARRFKISSSCVRMRAKREGWGAQIRAARAEVARAKLVTRRGNRGDGEGGLQSDGGAELAKTKAQLQIAAGVTAITEVMAARRDAYSDMLGETALRIGKAITETPDDRLFDRAKEIDILDKVARRSLGIADPTGAGVNVQVNVGAEKMGSFRAQTAYRPPVIDIDSEVA